MSVGGGEGVGGAERDRASSGSKRSIGKFVFSAALYLLSNIFPGKDNTSRGNPTGSFLFLPVIYVGAAGGACGPTAGGRGLQALWEGGGK